MTWPATRSDLWRTTYLPLRGSPCWETGRWWNPALAWRPLRGLLGGPRKTPTWLLWIYLETVATMSDDRRWQGRNRIFTFNLDLGTVKWEWADLPIEICTHLPSQSQHWSRSGRSSRKHTHRSWWPMRTSVAWLTNVTTNVQRWKRAVQDFSAIKEFTTRWRHNLVKDCIRRQWPELLMAWVCSAQSYLQFIDKVTHIKIKWLTNLSHMV